MIQLLIQFLWFWTQGFAHVRPVPHHWSEPSTAFNIHLRNHGNIFEPFTLGVNFLFLNGLVCSTSFPSKYQWAQAILYMGNICHVPLHVCWVVCHQYLCLRIWLHLWIGCWNSEWIIRCHEGEPLSSVVVFL